MSDVSVPLEITQALLDTGIREDCGKCPIALAFAIACPGASGIEVGRLYLDFVASGRTCDVHLPWEARNFIDAFDFGYKPAPRTLVIPIPLTIASQPGFLADESLLAPLALEPKPNNPQPRTTTMNSPNTLSPNSEPERIADARFLTLLGDLGERFARLESIVASLTARLGCCNTDRPESCGDHGCPEARRYDALERVHDELLAEADPFGIGPAGSATDMAEAFRFPPPPHVGIRRADDLLDQDWRLRIADHARNCTSLDGGAA